MKGIKIISIGVIVLAVFALIFRACVIKIQPGQAGVLNKEWGGGLQQADYDPGYYLALGPLHTWNVMNTTIQTLSMLKTSSKKARNRGRGYQQPSSKVMQPLKAKSSDGADVTLDITIKYQIEPGKAWQVFKEQGGEDRYKSQVAGRIKKTLMSGLGKLKTEQFFDPDSRVDTQNYMEDQLRPELTKIHVQLVGILIRDLEFQKSYEAKIKAKTLTKQRAELQRAKTKAAEALGETNRIMAESTAKVAVIEQGLEKLLTEMRAANDKKIQKVIADFEKYVTETRSEAELYAKEKEALGVKLLKGAEARGEALKRQALSTEGGSTLVALRLVEGLKFDDLRISTQLVNPLDLDEMMRRFGVK